MLNFEYFGGDNFRIESDKELNADSMAEMTALMSMVFDVIDKRTILGAANAALMEDPDEPEEPVI